MLNLMKRIAKDENGFVVSSELVLVLTIAVIGMIVGLDVVQNAVVEELADIAAAVGAMNQTYAFTGFSAGASIYTTGSTFADFKDSGDALGISGGVSQSVTVTAAVVETL